MLFTSLNFNPDCVSLLMKRSGSRPVLLSRSQLQRTEARWSTYNLLCRKTRKRELPGYNRLKDSFGGDHSSFFCFVIPQIAARRAGLPSAFVWHLNTWLLARPIIAHIPPRLEFERCSWYAEPNLGQLYLLLSFNVTAGHAKPASLISSSFPIKFQLTRFI